MGAAGERLPVLVSRRLYIGTAGWTVPRSVADQFPGTGSHLERYARTFSCVEINSSFHRDHARDTYIRWAGMTPRHFRFSVKIPQKITHEGALRRARKPLGHFIDQVQGLGSKLGPLLLQLPPSLKFETRVAKQFFAILREFHAGAVVCEPRHASWFEDRADTLMTCHRIARVAADPALHPNAHRPGGWMGTGRQAAVVYFRLHGSPRKYWSAYSRENLMELSGTLRGFPRSLMVWCIFDNTASGAAAENALWLRSHLQESDYARR